jgi:hypothetical protein
MEPEVMTATRVIGGFQDFENFVGLYYASVV